MRATWRPGAAGARRTGRWRGLFCGFANTLVLATVGSSSCVREAPAVAPRGPIEIHAHTIPVLAIDPEEWSEVLGSFGPSLALGTGPEAEARVTPSIALHALRIAGPEAQFPGEVLSSGKDVLRSLLQGNYGSEIYGASLFHSTRYGVRYRPAGPLGGMGTAADEAHGNQILASLGELGVSLETRLRLEDTDASLQDVLNDLVANFDPSAREIEWTSIALALYWPPKTSWTNKFGETTSFDQLSEELMARGFRRNSCGGTHVLQALLYLDRAHSVTPVLSPRVQAEVRAVLVGAVRAMRRNQLTDGSWNLDWSRQEGEASVNAHAGHHHEPDDDGERLLVTGHLAELLLCLPPELKLENEEYRVVGEWLWDWLRKNLKTQRSETQVCPVTHAACSVRQLLDTGTACCGSSSES